MEAFMIGNVKYTEQNMDNDYRQMRPKALAFAIFVVGTGYE